MTAEEIIDRLYQMPLTEFTRARNEAVRELRKAGQREEAEHLQALRKPTVAAAKLNRLVRENRAEVEEFLQAAAALRDAQLSGQGDLASSTKREHEALERLVRLGGEGVRQSLLAAAVDDDAAGQLLAARLERELEPRGFGTLLAHAPPAAKGRATGSSATGTQAAPQSAPPKDRRPRPDDRQARAELKEARAELRAAEAEERRAHENWKLAERQMAKAQGKVQQAQRELDRLQGVLYPGENDA